METFHSWAPGLSFAWGCAGEMQLGMIGPMTLGTAHASSEHPG